MRTIKFRGKRIDDEKWICGVPYGRGANCNILICEKTATPEMGTGSWLVDPATIGQFTGLTDKNGVEIFEGDILDCGAPFHHVVRWVDGAWHQISHINYDGGSLCQEYLIAFDKCVIGNIHDNPELLKNE